MEIFNNFTDPQIDAQTYGSHEECRKKIQESENLTVIHLNIRSLRKHYEELKVLTEIYHRRFDIIVCTETWKLGDPSMYGLDGYKLVYNYGQENQNDGVAMYIKNCYSFSEADATIGTVKGIRINLRSGSEDRATIIAIYRPHTTAVENFIEDLHEYLSGIPGEEVLLIGDLNINILGNTDNSENYLNNMSSLGYISVINTPTRIQGDTKTCIDHAFLKTRSSVTEMSAVILETSVTDHYPILVQWPVWEMRKEPKKEENTRRKVDYRKLKEQLQQASWGDVLEESTAEGATTKFVEIFERSVQQATTLVRSRAGKKCVPKKPWVTSGLITSIKTRDALYKRHLGNPKNAEFLQAFRTYRNKLNALLKKSEIMYYRERVTRCGRDMKSMWREIARITGKEGQANNREEIEAIMSDDNRRITDRAEISCEFNRYFASVGRTLAEKIEKVTSNPARINTTENSMMLYDVEPREVYKTIMSLKTGKAAGFDGISAEMLKVEVDSITVPLTHIINLAFKTGKCPSHFKTAIVIPVFKAGDREVISNYRPISLLPVISKVFEKCLANRVKSFLSKTGVMSEKQFGFWEGRSTESAIATLVKELYSALDNSKPCLTVFIDLAKAFDTLNHRKLLEKLYNYGLRGKVHDLVKNYLTDRNQCVRIRDVSSNSETSDWGVPQGTILGPLFFIIYMNDIFGLDITGKIISYADDTAITYTGDNWERLVRETERDLPTLKSWFDANDLTMNIKKTNFVPFGCYADSTPNDLHTLTLHQNGCKQSKEPDCGCSKIQKADSVKYLGIWIDKNMRWDKQAEMVGKTLRYINCKLYRLRQILQKREMRMVYLALVEAILFYGVIGWGGAYENVVNKLQKLQKAILRTILNRHRRYPSKELFRELGVLNVREKYCITATIFCKRNGLIEATNHEKSTRNKQRHIARLPKCNRKIGTRCYYYVGTKMYNLYLNSEEQLGEEGNMYRKLKAWVLAQTEDAMRAVI